MSSSQAPGDRAEEPWLWSGAPLGRRLATLLLGAAGAGLTLLVFVPPMASKFTSDTFYLYTRAIGQTPQDIAALFVPVTDNWYRPVTDLAMWLERAH